MTPFRWRFGLATLAAVSCSLTATPASRNEARASYGYPPHIDGARVETYRRIGDTALQAYIFEPVSDSSAPRPAIVFFFGGGWRQGSPEQFAPHCRHFAARGMVAVAADYRVASRHGVKAADCVRDAVSCIRWVRQHAERLRIDPDRIAAAGGSAGGHLAAATATLIGFDEEDADQAVSARPNALVLFNPALVLAPMKGLKLEGFGTNLGQERLGAEPEELSPSHHLLAGMPPTIIFHGQADTTVPYRTAEAYTRLAKELGNRCELKGYAGQGHGFFNQGRPGDYYDTTLAEADNFFVSLGWLEP